MMNSTTVWIAVLAPVLHQRTHELQSHVVDAGMTLHVR